MKTAFYKFQQNNSGGSFVTDDKLCHVLVIEALSEREAIAKAEDLGCYWDGCDSGNDCPCCGDRWYKSADEIDFSQYKEKGYGVGVYDHYPDAEERWLKLYGALPRLKDPKWSTEYGSRKFTGSVYFDSLEQYCQFNADQYGWTTPDCRIFRLDGSVTEIFKQEKD